MNEKVKIGETVHGTPIYFLQIEDEKLLAGLGRARNPLVRGKLRDYIQERFTAPVVVIVQPEKKFTRILKLTEEGLLIPIQLNTLPADCRNKLVELGVVSPHWRPKGK